MSVHAARTHVTELMTRMSIVIMLPNIPVTLHTKAASWNIEIYFLSKRFDILANVNIRKECKYLRNVIYRAAR